MERFFDKTKKLIFIKQGGIISSALILALMIIISRIFGFFRYRILVGYFTKENLDVFFASFRIPDLIFEILITGALTSSLIPIIVKYQKNKQELEENISSIINFITIILFAFIIIVFLLMDKIIFLITPGFPPDKTAMVIYYSRILLIGQLPFLVIGNFITGIAQANKTFLLTAIAPIVYNLIIIVVTFLFAKNYFLFAPIMGTVIGAFLFFLIQTPLPYVLNFNYFPIIRFTKALSEFIVMVIPRIFTVLVAQIDATIDLTLTSFLGAGSYTIFYLAQHLQLLPVSVIGIAFGQASLPYLSELYADKRIDEFKKIVVDSILNLFFLTIPIMSFFVFARTPLVRLFFGGQKFDWVATVQTALTLSYFALSLPFHTIYYFLTRCFYALLDSKTPFIISVLSIAVNTIVSLIFIIILKLPVWALAISFSLAMIINVLLLIILLIKKMGGFTYRFFIIELTKILLATAIASTIAYYSMKIMDNLIFDTTRTINVFFLLITGAGIYFVLYFFIGWIFDIKEIYLLSKLLLKAQEYQKKILEIYTSYE